MSEGNLLICHVPLCNYRALLVDLLLLHQSLLGDGDIVAFPFHGCVQSTVDCVTVLVALFLIKGALAVSELKIYKLDVYIGLKL